MMMLPVTAGPQTSLVSARNWIKVRLLEPKSSPMMIALKAAKSAVFMALHSVSVTILVVKPREAASSISIPVRFSTKRRSLAKAETVGVGVVGMLVE